MLATTALLTLLVASSATSATKPNRNPDGAVVARIGSYEITRSQLDAYWDALPAAGRQHYAQSGGLRAYLDDIIEQKLLIFEAERLGLPERPDLKIIIENGRDNILGRALIEQEVTNKIVTEEAVRAYYEEHRQGFEIPEMRIARHILATPHAQGHGTNSREDDAVNEDEAKAKIERLAKEIANGADFAALATEWSEDITAKDGGLLDPFPKGRMAKAFEDAAWALEPGQVSDIVRSPYGYHIIKLEERRPTHIPPLEELEGRIRTAVAQERKESFQPRLEQLKERLRKQSGVEVFDDRLRERSTAQTSPATAPTR